MNTLQTYFILCLLLILAGLAIAVLFVFREKARRDAEEERKAEILRNGSGGGGGPKEPA